MLFRTQRWRSPQAAQLAHVLLLQGLLPAACIRPKSACGCPLLRSRCRCCCLQLSHVMGPALQGRCLLLLLLLAPFLQLGVPCLQLPLLYSGLLLDCCPLLTFEHCFTLLLVCTVQRSCLLLFRGSGMLLLSWQGAAIVLPCTGGWCRRILRSAPHSGGCLLLRAPNWRQICPRAADCCALPPRSCSTLSLDIWLRPCLLRPMLLACAALVAGSRSCFLVMMLDFLLPLPCPLLRLVLLQRHGAHQVD